MRLDQHTSLVTGSTGGLGAAICRRLAEDGARLVVTDIDVEPCRELIDRLPGTGHQALALDVADEDAWERLATDLGAAGSVDSLVNNAGIGSLATVETEQLETWRRVMDIDVTGVWLGMKHVGPLIERSGGGSIVNVSSILGTVGGFGNSAAYHAAKGAVRTLTKNAALHWATSGVRVNSLHPGFIGTRQLLERHEGSERHRSMLEGTPMGRLGTPEEVAAVVAFLASTDSGFMTGSEVYADGGFTAR